MQVSKLKFLEQEIARHRAKKRLHQLEIIELLRRVKHERALLSNKTSKPDSGGNTKKD